MAREAQRAFRVIITFSWTAILILWVSFNRGLFGASDVPARATSSFCPTSRPLLRSGCALLRTRGSRGSDPRPLRLTMDALLDRTCGERPRGSRIVRARRLGVTDDRRARQAGQFPFPFVARWAHLRNEITSALARS